MQSENEEIRKRKKKRKKWRLYLTAEYGFDVSRAGARLNAFRTGLGCLSHCCTGGWGKSEKSPEESPGSAKWEGCRNIWKRSRPFWDSTCPRSGSPINSAGWVGLWVLKDSFSVSFLLLLLMFMLRFWSILRLFLMFPWFKKIHLLVSFWLFRGRSWCFSNGSSADIALLHTFPFLSFLLNFWSKPLFVYHIIIL